MSSATYNGAKRDWEEALTMLIDGRNEIIRLVLPLDRDAWRIRPDHGKWCIAQILEHLNDIDRHWQRMLGISSFFARFCSPLDTTITTLENPFGNNPYKTNRLLSHPKGNARRASMVAEFEIAARSIEHRIGQLSDSKRKKMRFYSPVAGITGITEAILMLHYHDRNHLNQIIHTIETLRSKGIRTEPKPESGSSKA